MFKFTKDKNEISKGRTIEINDDGVFELIDGKRTVILINFPYFSDVTNPNTHVVRLLEMTRDKYGDDYVDDSALYVPEECTIEDALKIAKNFMEKMDQLKAEKERNKLIEAENCKCRVCEIDLQFKRRDPEPISFIDDDVCDIYKICRDCFEDIVGSKMKEFISYMPDNIKYHIDIGQDFYLPIHQAFCNNPMIKNSSYGKKMWEVTENYTMQIFKQIESYTTLEREYVYFAYIFSRITQIMFREYSLATENLTRWLAYEYFKTIDYNEYRIKCVFNMMSKQYYIESDESLTRFDREYLLLMGFTQIIDIWNLSKENLSLETKIAIGAFLIKIHHSIDLEYRDFSAHYVEEALNNLSR